MKFDPKQPKIKSNLDQNLSFHGPTGLTQPQFVSQYQDWCIVCQARGLL